MKITISALLLAAGICGVVVGHSHGETREGKQTPLHEQEFVQDGPEELERKWSFEVRLSVSFLVLVWACDLQVRKGMSRVSSAWDFSRSSFVD